MQPCGLRLELTPDRADQLLEDRPPGSEPEVVALRSIYFDTPGLHLRKAGHSLRIRRMKCNWVQTARLAGSAPVVHVRRIQRPEPALDDDNPLRSLLDDKTGELEPHFEVRVERRIWTLSESNGSAAVILDRGEVISGRHTAPVCDLSLEPGDGGSGFLFDLATRIGSIVPVRLGIHSRTDQGYLLRDGWPNAFRAERIVLSEQMAAAEAFQAAALSCVRQYRLNEGLLLTGRSQEALHHLRLALGRFRCALTVFRSIVGKDEKRAWSRRLHVLTERSGEARDLDVLLSIIPNGKAHAAISRLREEAYDRLLELLDSQDARSLPIDALRWISSGPWLSEPETQPMREMPAGEFVAASLDRLHRKLAASGRKLRKMTDEERHEVRKTARKLRFAGELVLSLPARSKVRRRRKKYLRDLKALQDELGALNDLATASATLHRLGFADEPHLTDLAAPERKAALVRNVAGGFRDLMKSHPFR